MTANLSDKIIIIEGMDCTGKTEIAKELADYYNLQAVDTDWGKDEWDYKNDLDWAPFVGGMNLMLSQFAISTSGWVKARYHLTEKVYSNYYKRKTLIPFETVDDLIKDKAILVWLDLGYQKYLELMKEHRQHEKILDYNHFCSQRVQFDRAFKESKIVHKFQVYNKHDFGLLKRKVIHEIDNIKW